MTDRTPTAAARALLLALLYFATGWLGLMVPAFGSHITLIWLPTGIAVAAMMRCNFGCWPGVTIGALAISLVTGLAWPAALGIALGNTAGPLLTAWILRRKGFHPAFDRRRDILLLAGAAAIGMVVSASLGVATLALAGELQGGWLAAWLSWWAGDIMGVIVAAPLLLSFTRQEWRTIASRLGEFLIWICTAGLLAFLVFFVHPDGRGRMWAPSFLTLPLVAWAAMRFGTIGTSFAIILLSTAAASATASGHGPFVRANPAESALPLWLFMATCAALGWLITALQSARAKAMGIQHLLEQALSDVSLGVLLGDLDRNITYANAGFTRLTGYTEADLLGKSCRILQGPGTDPVVAEKLRAALSGDGFFDGDILNYRKDGTTFWNGLLISPVHDERGEKTGFLAMQRDITKRRETEAAMNTAAGFTRSLIGSMQDGFSVLDANGVLVDVNPSLCNMTGFSREELIGRSPPFPYWAPEEQERIHAGVRETLKGHFSNREVMFMRKNGERFPVIVSPSGIKNKEGGIVNFLATIKDITERKQAEVELRTSEQRHRAILDSALDAIVTMDAAGQVVEFNPAAERMFGYARTEAVGRDMADLIIPPAFREQHQRGLARYLAGGQAAIMGRQIEIIALRRGGTEFPVELCIQRVGQAEPPLFTGFIRDITARRQAEEALLKANQKLKLHFEQTPMAVIEWDLEFRVTQWNPAAQTIFGFSREEAVGQHASFIVPKKFHEHVDQVWQALLKRSGGERSSNENVRKDGANILCEWYNTPLVDARGTVVGVASVVMDITERRQTQQLLAWEKDAMELITSATSLRDVLDGLMHSLEKQAPGALCSILLLDDDGVHVRHGAAPSLPDAYNRAIDGVAIGPNTGSCGTAAYENRQVIVADIASDPLWIDYRDLAAEHGLRACWSTPIHGSKRKILGTFAIYYREPRHPAPAEIELIGRAAHIISVAIERKQADEALRESELKFRTLFENAGDAIFLMQGEMFVDCNVRTLEMFGCQARGQIVGHPPYEFSPARQPDGRESRESAIEKITAAFAGRPQSFEWMHTKLDGAPFPAEVTLNTVTLGGQVMLQAIVRDISERKRAEEEIRALNAALERRVEERTRELQAANKELEAFSYSVSHDLKAPLRALDGFSRIVVRNYADRLDDDGRKMLEMIRTGAQQMGRLIDDLLAFSRIGRRPLEPSEIDMRALAQVVFDGLIADEPGRELRLDLRPLPAARGTQAMIRQVWANLIGNAVKFTRKRGVGEIEIGVKDGDGGERIYYIKDNGAGFDMQQADRLFGVFQRLHAAEEFEGTGIGLALVQRIVQRHGGRIWAEAEVDRGATFYFTLPGPKP